MAEGWTPALQLQEVGGNCRLSLAGHVYGHGRTLQEAGDDLIRRLLSLAMAFHSGSGVRASSEVRHDLRWLDYLYELGEIAARGDDIRGRVFGA